MCHCRWPSRELRIFYRIHGRRGMECNGITTSNHIPGIAIQGRFRVGIRQQGQDGPTGWLQSPGGRPFLFQYIQAYITRSKMYIGVKNLIYQLRKKRRKYSA
jgi:hypothetical protein